MQNFPSSENSPSSNFFSNNIREVFVLLSSSSSNLPRKTAQRNSTSKRTDALSGKWSDLNGAKKVLSCLVKWEKILLSKKKCKTLREIVNIILSNHRKVGENLFCTRSKWSGRAGWRGVGKISSSPHFSQLGFTLSPFHCPPTEPASFNSSPSALHPHHSDVC